MNSLTGNILIDFQSMSVSEQQRDYHKQVYGAIKLQLSQMQKYDKTSHFVHCKRQKCNMVLTVEDKASVYDWQQINSNKAEFKDVLQKCGEEGENAVVWICSFCEHKNIVNCGQLKFARNNSRVVHKGGNQGGQKKEPILLIVFDISGSMEEQLSNDQSSLVERVKKTKIYQKIVAEEEREINELLEKEKIKVEGADNKMKYKDYLKKNKLLMGLTQSLITEINPSNANEKMERVGGFKGGEAKKTKLSKTIGFIFFHSNVILDPAMPEKRPIVICDTQSGYAGKTENMIRERVNFDDFESLFKLGANYGQQYTTKLNQFQFGNLDYKLGDYTHGQTALGPAIVLATGVVSQHGAGSSIVVVTDGIGNKGIFDQSEKWEEPLERLKMRLQKQKSFLAILQCRNINEGGNNNNNIKTCIDDFCLKHEQMLARKINILVDKNKSVENLTEDIKKKLSTSINRDHVIWTNQVLIRSQNPNVTFDQDIKKLSLKLHNQQQPCYIHPKIDYNKLKQKDYIHHFMTQAVIRYENTQTGEQSTFMTYIQQKFIKFNTIRKQTIKKLDNQKTFHEMLEYLSAEEDNYDISNIPLGFVKKTFRDTLMFSKSICNRSLRFPLRPNQPPEEESNFFDDIYRKTDPKTIFQVNEDDQDITL